MQAGRRMDGQIGRRRCRRTSSCASHTIICTTYVFDPVRMIGCDRLSFDDPILVVPVWGMASHGRGCWHRSCHPRGFGIFLGSCFAFSLSCMLWRTAVCCISSCIDIISINVRFCASRHSRKS